MGKIVVIAEKPALGRAIADALPGNESVRSGIIEKGEYSIIWAFGHLLTLKDPEEYDEKYKNWKMEDLPVYFEPWGNRIKAERKREEGQQSLSARVKQIGDLLRNADSVIHAGDTDEEGQLLIDELLRWFQYSGKVMRLDTSNTAKDAMVKALKRMEDNRKFEADGWSAYGRQLGDKIFGYNLTRYYTIVNKCYPPLTVGRVQTPTLGLVVKRDEQIEQHKKIRFYDLILRMSLEGVEIPVKFTLDEKDTALTEGKCLHAEHLQKIGQTLVGKRFSELKIVKKTEQEAPPLPFNLTKLNTYCSQKWGMSPDTVMKVTQNLREKYKAITYNRSDCQYLSEEHFKEAPRTIVACTGNLGIAANQFDSDRKSRCFDDKNLTAHFAIIPTTERFEFGKLTDMEKKIYSAISSYYLVQFLPPAEREKTSMEVTLKNGNRLYSVGSVLEKEGYLQLLKSESAKKDKTQNGEENKITELAEGIYEGEIVDFTVKEGETKPLKRYTQGSLFHDMGCIAKYVENPKVKELLLEKDKGKKGESGSIGTVATRALIIKHLIDIGYLEETGEGKSKALVSTPKGRAFYHMLPDAVKGADVTASWWVIQEDIKTGKTTPKELGETVLKAVQDVITSGKGKLEIELNRQHETYTCPNCGGEFRKGRFGFYCKNKCGFSIAYAFGKKLSESQIISLIEGKKTLIKGISKKVGGTYSAYAVPSGVEPYRYEKDGQNAEGFRLKLEMEFPKTHSGW